MAVLQGESFDVAPGRTANGRSHRQMMRMTREGQGNTCVYCGQLFKSGHVLQCTEWAAEVYEAQVLVCRAAATHGRVGKMFGQSSDEAPSWRSERGWEECKPSSASSSDGAESSTTHGGVGEGSGEPESEIGQEAMVSQEMEIDPQVAREERAQLVLDKAGWLEAGNWGKEEKDGSDVSKGKFVRLPAPLVEATIAAMQGELKAGSKDEAALVAEAMATAACTVPSIMALADPAERTTARAVLVDWATLEPSEHTRWK